MDSPDILLKELEDKPVYAKVSFKAKVIAMDEPVKLSGGLTKQEVTVSDSTALARLTLWWVGHKHFMSYHFKNMTVRSFKQEKYFSKPRHDGSFEEISNIG